jgi:hypothetical protein
MPHNFIPTSFDYGSDIVVIGHNSESADYDNPRGAIHGLRPYIRAIDAEGNTMIKWSAVTFHVREYEDVVHAEAKAHAERLNERLLHRRKPDFSSWQEGRPVYGSPAYEAYGRDDDLAWERSMEEEAGF